MACTASASVASAAAQARPAGHVPHPVVSGVSHQRFASGGTVGGAQVTVTGSNFTGVRSVSFGDARGSNVHVVSSHTLTVTAPGHAVAEVHVRVVSRGGQSAATSHDLYDFQQRRVVAGGQYDTCRVEQPGGSVFCFGEGDHGELGDGGTTNSSTPVEVTGIGAAVAVALGDHHSCALIASGAVYCWGSNADGQLGDGATTDSTTPVRVVGLGGRALQISAGEGDTCAIVVGNHAKCWGADGSGQLGIGTVETSVARPTAVVDLGQVVDTAPGEFFTCAVRTTGSEYCWGDNGYGQLGDGSTTDSLVPVRTGGITKATATAAELDTGCVLLRGGAVQCWGYGQGGETGDGSFKSSPRPVSVAGVGGASEVTAEAGDACALVHGSVLCWGFNEDGEVGNGTTHEAASPSGVVGLSNVVALGSGYYHGVAVLKNGTTKVWGANNYGAFGNGTTTNSTVPVTGG